MNNALNGLRGSSYDYSSSGLLMGGGGVKRWLKEEIPLEDRKKILKRLRSPDGSTSNLILSKAYLFTTIHAGRMEQYIASNLALGFYTMSVCILDVVSLPDRFS